MLDYARLRICEHLQGIRKAVLVTSGPGGVQAGEYTCQVDGLDLYVLVPQSADLLFNLEEDHNVVVLAAGWEMRGTAWCQDRDHLPGGLQIVEYAEAEWCQVVRVRPVQMKVRSDKGWGFVETIDL